MTLGTDLYLRVIVPSLPSEIGRAELMLRVWEPTPWIVNVWTGGFSEEFGREMEIREWCTGRFGPECFVLSRREGKWQRGSVTISGWTWMGFATEAMMNEFIAKWGIEKPEVSA